MTDFDLAEKRNRPKAVAVLNSILNLELYELEESPVEKMEHYDFAIKRKSDGKIVAYIEHKDRNYPSTSFDDWLLSAKKKAYLDQYPQPTYYLNTFTDGAWAMWNTKNTTFTRKPIFHSSYTVCTGGTVEENGYFYKISDGMNGKYDTVSCTADVAVSYDVKPE